MSLILKPVFDVLTGDVAVCDNIFYNYLILLFVGEVAFRCAYALVGKAYQADIITGRITGSILHWAIRFPIYMIIAYLLRAGIWICNFVVNIPTWIWWILLVVCLLVVAIVVYFIVNSKQKTI